MKSLGTESTGSNFTGSFKKRVHLSGMKDLPGLCTVMSNDWSLFVRLCVRITTWQKSFWHKSKLTSLSCLLTVSMIIKDICSFRHLRVAFTCFRFRNITLSINSLDFSVLDQWLSEKVTLKSAGKSNVLRYLLVFSSRMSWIGRDFPVMLTVKVTLICLWSSIPLIDTAFAPFGLKVYFPGETYGKGVWSRFRISSLVVCHVMFLNNRRNASLECVSFSSIKNCFLGSILPVVPSLFDRSIDFHANLGLTDTTRCRR